MKEFTAAVREKEEGDEITFKIEGREMTARRPKQAVFAEVAMSARPGATTADKLDAVFTFFGGPVSDSDGKRHGGILEVEDWKWLHDRMIDPKDDLDLPLLMEVVEYIIAEFSGTPTSSPTDS